MLLGMINGFVTAAKQKKAADRIKPVQVDYSESEFAKEGLGMARARLNARAAGADNRQRQIGQNQATTLDAITRNSRDSGGAIAAAMATQAQSNEAMAGLQEFEAQDYDRKLGNLTAAQQTMTGERDKVFEDDFRTYQEDRADKAALMQSSMQNKQNAFNSLDNAIGTAVSLAAGIPPGLLKSGGGGGAATATGGAGAPALDVNYDRLMKLIRNRK